MTSNSFRDWLFLIFGKSNIVTAFSVTQGGGKSPPHPPISYTVIKFFLIGLASCEIYFYMFWPNLDNFFAEGLLVEDRYNISRISDTYKKSFICILLKHCYIPHINNILLIPDFVRPMMTCLWHHYWHHDVSWRLNKQKFFTI